MLVLTFFGLTLLAHESLEARLQFPELDGFLIASLKHSEETILHGGSLNRSINLDPYTVPSFSMFVGTEVLDFDSNILTGLAKFQVEHDKDVDSKGNYRFIIRYPMLSLSSNAISGSSATGIEDSPNLCLVQFEDVVLVLDGKLSYNKATQHFELRQLIGTMVPPKKVSVFSVNSKFQSVISSLADKVLPLLTDEFMTPLLTFLEEELRFWLKNHSKQDIQVGNLKLGNDVMIEADRNVNLLSRMFFSIQAQLRHVRSRYEKGSFEIAVVTKRITFVHEISVHHHFGFKIYQVHARLDDLMLHNLGDRPISQYSSYLPIKSLRFIIDIKLNKEHIWTLDDVTLVSIVIDKSRHKADLPIRRNLFPLLLIWMEEDLVPLLNDQIKKLH